MPKPPSFDEAVRAQVARRTLRLQRYTISSFNPDVVAACALWEWDRNGPLRRMPA